MPFKKNNKMAGILFSDHYNKLSNKTSLKEYLLHILIKQLKTYFSIAFSVSSICSIK